MREKTLISRLRDRREDADLTQTQVAAVLHMSQTGYSKYETGENDIPTQVLIRLARFYGDQHRLSAGAHRPPGPSVKEEVPVNQYPRIRDLREDADLTQAQVGERLGLSQRTYAYYESGQRMVPPEVLCALGDLYGVSVDYLLGRTDRREMNR